MKRKAVNLKGRKVEVMNCYKSLQTYGIVLNSLFDVARLRNVFSSALS
jgi:hypothetical protein